MITVDSKALLNDLQMFYMDTVRRMEAMVAGFAYEVTLAAIDNTPFGDDIKYASLYSLPSRLKYLPARAGSAKGGWVIGMNAPDGDMFPAQATSQEATNIKNTARWDASRYKLGDTVFITNYVPYVGSDGWTFPSFKSLESGYSPNAPLGIMSPTLENIQATYKIDLMRYYKQG